MFQWLKRLILEAKQRRKLDKIIESNYPTEVADNSNFLPLDPKNDPWGRR